VINLKGVALPEQYPESPDYVLLEHAFTNISHSDTMQHINKIHYVKGLISEGSNPIVADKEDVSLIYIFFGLVSIYILGLNQFAYHNLFFLSVFSLSGFFMYLFSKKIFKNRSIAIFSGFLYFCSYYVPYAYYWGHSNTMQIQWIPLIFYLIEKLVEKPNRKNSIYLALALFAQVISGTYHTIHLSFMIPLYVVLRYFFLEKKFLKNKELWKHLTTSAAIAGILSLPYLIRKLNSYVIIRTIQENQLGYWRLDSLREILNMKFHLYMGIIQLTLVIIGSYLIFKKRKEFLMFFHMMIISLALIIGPVSSITPYYLLFKFWPFFDHLRVPFRMFPFFLFSLSVVAGIPLLEIKDVKKRNHSIIFLILIILLIQVFLSPWLFNLRIFFP